MNVEIRPEAPADRPAVQALIEAAFRPADDPGGPVAEAVLNDELRGDPAWIPGLTLVAHAGGEVVGQLTCSYGIVDDPVGTKLVGVGPVAVLPARQGASVGSALMRALVQAADAAGQPALVLLGSPDFYGRFGFVAASDLGIESPDPSWGKYFQVRPLAAFNPEMVGRFRYAAPFERL